MVDGVEFTVPLTDPSAALASNDVPVLLGFYPIAVSRNSATLSYQVH